MFRSMRRQAQQLSPEACEEILKAGSEGVLALSGDDGYPYALPINYFWLDGCCFFHCAKEGHKIDAVRRCDKASLAVIGESRIRQKDYSTFYRSVIVFGRISEVTDETEKRRLLIAMTEILCPEEPESGRQAAVRQDIGGVCILRLTPEHISGKCDYTQKA